MHMVHTRCLFHTFPFDQVQQIDRVVEVVEETLQGRTVRLFGQRREKGRKLGGAPLHLPKIRKNPLIEIIAVNTG